MEFKVSDLERDPIDFDLQFEPGAIDFGDEAQQTSVLASEGRAQGDCGRHQAEGKV
jgi:uncharacterized protein